jgi:divalent metal cation (Fe/Co/Zn/Cd) transporter
VGWHQADQAAGRIIAYDQVRYRFNGSSPWADLRLLVDPKMSIGAGRELAAAIEHELRKELAGATIVARVEPHEDGSPSRRSTEADASDVKAGEDVAAKEAEPPIQGELDDGDEPAKG